MQTKKEKRQAKKLCYIDDETKIKQKKKEKNRDIEQTKIKFRKVEEKYENKKKIFQINLTVMLSRYEQQQNDNPD